MAKQIKQDLQKMEVSELEVHADAIRKELFLIRMKKSSSPEKNTSLPKILRKNLARVLTVLNQKEL